MEVTKEIKVISDAHAKACKSLDSRVDKVKEDLAFFKGLASPKCKEKILTLEEKLANVEGEKTALEDQNLEMFSHKRTATARRKAFNAVQKSKKIDAEHSAAFGSCETYSKLSSEKRRLVDNACAQGELPSLNLVAHEDSIFESLAPKGSNGPNIHFRFGSRKTKSGKRKSVINFL
jgi:hypothetical protein